MTTEVKRRRYHSEIRARRAQATRARILAAARRLFRQRGYVRTSIEDVARQARVAPATVYLGFGSKRAILLALVGEVRTSPEAERLNASIGAERSLRRRLELAARITRIITESAWDLMEMGRIGAATDPDLAAAWARGSESRHEAVAGAIRPALPPSLPRAAADAFVDVVWALTGPELYGALVRERGWPADRYEEALRDLLIGAAPLSRRAAQR